MDRRQFIKRSSQAALGIAIGGFAPPSSAGRTDGGQLDFSVPQNPSLPRIAIAKGQSPGEMAEEVLGALGGIERFIRKGDRVVVKPNATWDRTPEQGANTNPRIVETVVRMCLKAGAAQVVVIDNPLDEPRRCLARSGIGSAVEKAGGRVELPGSRSFRDTQIPGSFIKKWPVMNALFGADKFINVPVVKNHGLSTLTAAMKNLYGVIGGDRGRLHAGIHESIFELASFVRPTLVILDAVRVMIKNGPTGGRPEDLIHPRMVIAGTDQVALDAFAASLIGVRPEDVGYIKLAHTRGLGTMKYKELSQKIIS